MVRGIASMIQFHAGTAGGFTGGRSPVTRIRCKAASSGSRRTEAITFTGAFPAGTADGFTGAALRGPVAGEDFDGGSGHEDVIGSLVPAQL